MACLRLWTFDLSQDEKGWVENFCQRARRNRLKSRLRFDLRSQCVRANRNNKHSCSVNADGSHSFQYFELSTKFCLKPESKPQLGLIKGGRQKRVVALAPSRFQPFSPLRAHLKKTSTSHKISAKDQNMAKWPVCLTPLSTLLLSSEPRAGQKKSFQCS